MTTRHAACSCEQLRLTAEGDPIRVSICHCLACQRRTGSVFGVQARFDADQVRIEGTYSEYVRYSDEGGDERRSSFCPHCGATVFFHVFLGAGTRGSRCPPTSSTRPNSRARER